MNNSWSSVIFLKTKKEMPEQMMAQMMGVKNIWSTSGDWDWCIKLDSAHSTPDKTEMFVSKLRQADWIAETKTSWWKEVAAN